MKKYLLDLPIRTIVLAGILLGTSLGAAHVRADYIPESGMECRSPVQGCLINGCRKASLHPDAPTVCNYSGENCPPLTACV